MKNITPLSNAPVPRRTRAQETFWQLLQTEANRALPRLELCKMAGYSTLSPWYLALKDPVFEASVEALGIAVQHFTHTTGVVELADDADEEWRKDRIDLRRLTREYPKHMTASVFKVNFSVIRNPALKTLVKRYFRAHLGFWEVTTLKTQFMEMQPFLLIFGEAHPEADSFALLTREMIEPLLTRATWTDAQGRGHTISPQKKSVMLASLNRMLMYMRRHGWKEAPLQMLIYEEDYPRLAKRRPRPLPPDVFEQVVNHSHLLPPYARNLVDILSVVGLRAEDAMHLSEECLEYDADGDPRLQWYNHKMRRDGRLLPITTAVVDAIKRQRELVKDIPDLFGKHYLFRTKKGLYQFDRFSEQLNILAQQAPILGEDGQVYHFTPHRFRHTVGTQMLNGGMGIADVMTYLDHMSPEMTLRYARISDETLKHKFKALVLSGKAGRRAGFSITQRAVRAGG
jgi:integrase